MKIIIIILNVYIINTNRKRNKMAQTLAEKACQRIKKLIISNKYAPGAPLQEQELIKKMHMSRTPIREALRKLEHENLVEIIPQKGAFVNKISPQKLQELFQIREIIEPKVAELATINISIEKLCDIERQMLQLKTKKEIDYSDFYKVGQGLHDLILASVGNKTLIQNIKGLSIEITRACHFAMIKPGSAQKFLEQHLEIIATLKTRDSVRAKQKMLEHILTVKSSVFA